MSLDMKNELLDMDFRHWEGPPKTLIIKTLDSNDKLQKINTVQFNKNGQILNTELLDKDGKVCGCMIYKYDEHGNEIEWIDENEYSNYRIIQRFDEQNRRVEKISYDEYQEQVFHISYTYNQEGQIAKQEEKYRESRFVNETIEYVYQNGLLTEKITYSQNMLTSTITYQYDERGNKKTLREYSYRDKDPTEKYEFIYQQDTDLLEYVDIYNRHNEIVQKVIYSYDDENRLIEIKTIEFDDDETIDNQDVEVRLFLGYDSRNNWTETVKSRNGVITQRLKVEIIYWE